MDIKAFIFPKNCESNSFQTSS